MVLYNFEDHHSQLTVKFKNYIVLDLEATCWEKREHTPNETIGIGALLINEQPDVVSEFVQFIQPVKHPI